MRILFACFLMVFFCLPLLALCPTINQEDKKNVFPDQNNSKVICASGSLWYQFNRMSLETRDNPQTYKRKWQLEIEENKDFSLSIDEQNGVEKRKGKIMVIAGAMMLTNGIDLKEGYEIDALDGPILISELAISLLQCEFPDGPKSVNKRSSFEFTEKAKDIKVTTPSAEGVFPAPWILKGIVEKAGETITFDLSFSYMIDRATSKESITLRGIWEKSIPAPQFPDTMSLEGWKFHRIGPYERKTSNSTIIDYGARPLNISYKTLDELRKSCKIKEKD